MKIKHILTPLVWSVLFVASRWHLCLCLALTGASAAGATLPGQPGSLRPRPDPDAVPIGLSAPDWGGIRRQYEQHRHAVVRAEGGHQARNPGQQWNTRFDGRGFTVEPERGRSPSAVRTNGDATIETAERPAGFGAAAPGDRARAGASDGAWAWGLELRGYGFAGSECPVSRPARVSAGGQRVAYDWDGTMEEWFVNDRRGLEHGFTVKGRPAVTSPLSSQPSTLNFLLAVRGGLRPEVQADGRGVRFVDGRGAAAVTYTGLKVFDADGRDLPARFESAAEGLRLAIDERGARYPLTIDPIAQQAVLTAFNAGANDQFGTAIAVSGDTAVVGAPSEDSNATGVNSDPNDNSATNSGAVYVFVRNGTTWTQQAYLKASNTDPNDQFGISVAVSGDTVVVGAIAEDSNATGINGDQANNSAFSAGAVYVFVRSGTNWTQQAYLKPSNTEAGDDFGYSVAVSDDTVVVGARDEGSNSTGVNGADNNFQPGAGAAYVFVRSGASWSQQAYLKASNTGGQDQFGWAVAASGTTVVIGAYQEDSSATGVNGDGSNNTGANAGAAYVFVRSGTNWSQQAYLKASSTGLSDQFGGSVAVSGDTIVVGALSEDSNAIGVNGDQSNNSASGAGAAYVFVRSGTNWSQQAYLKASNTGSGDQFGSAVAVSGDLVVVAATGEDSNATGVNGNQANNFAFSAGAAYVFTRTGTNWNQLAYLKGSNTDTNDFFGSSVAMTPDAVFVGARGAGFGASTGPGAAYVFTDPGDSEIAVEQPAGNNLTDGAATVDFGGVTVGANATRTFTIRNTGAGDLSGLGITIDGVHAAEFTVTLAPVAPGGSTTFTVRFAPVAAGTRTAALHLASNDADETPFDIALAGTGLVPEIAVEQPAGSDLTDGAATVDFGGVVAGASAAQTFTVRNLGAADLTSLDITFTGSHPADFTVTANPGAPVAPGGSTTFTVTFSPTGSGTRTAGLRLANNDADEHPFNITLTGTRVVPEIAVQQPDGVNLSDGAATVDFGGVLPGSNSPRTFTIRAFGTAHLTGLNLTINGANAADFTLTTAPATTVAPGDSTTFIVTFAPGALGARTAALHIASNDADENPFDIALTGAGVIPEIGVELQGGGTLVDGGSVDFGALAVGAATPLSFTIHNLGTANLTGLDIVFDGANAGDFTLTAAPAAPVTPGSIATFTVTFAPTVGTAAGSPRTAALHIASNDADENPFDLALTGTGYTPEIAVEQVGGTNLVDGVAATSFGNVALGANAFSLYRIRNLSSVAALTGVVVTIDGPNASEFSLTFAPPTTIGGGGFVAFGVRFSPTGGGARAAALHIFSNDSDENPFDIALTGTGTAPEIAVEQPVGTDLTDGAASVDFGGVSVGNLDARQFHIQNTGTANLTTLGVTIDGANAADFTVSANTTGTVLPGGNLSFFVTFTPSAAGPRTATLHIASNDADENPFDIALTGTGLAPEIAVEQPAGNDLTDGTAIVDYGPVAVRLNSARPFTIRNIGAGDLTGMGPTIGGPNAADFRLFANPPTAWGVAPGGSSGFALIFAPSAAGVRTATLQIASNDSDENPFDITVTGTGVLAPEIVMDLFGGPALTDGAATVDFFPVNIGSSSQQHTFIIRNYGSGDLTGLDINFDGPNATEFTVLANPTSPVPPDGTTSFTVRFAPTSGGARLAGLHITSNDSDESPFDIALTATGLAPEIAVEQPAGNNLADGAATVDFGITPAGASAPLEFTIRNTGAEPLTGLNITRDGGNAADFIVTTLPVAPVLPGDFTTFTVSFTPTGNGPRTATLRIASNDADENPFDIALTGTGLAPEIAVEQPAGNDLIDGAVSVNFGGATLGLNASRPFLIRNVGSADLTGLVPMLDGANAGDFAFVELPVAPVAPGDDTPFIVRFTPSAPGPRVAVLRLESNDGDENPFDIALTGTGLAPEISVEQPAGTDLTDGAATVDFGNGFIGCGAARRFTVRNAGPGDLLGIVASMVGPNAADFVVTVQPAVSLPGAGGSTTFTVEFRPGVIGPRAATLRIASNDPDENPFDIALMGDAASPVQIAAGTYFKASNTGIGDHFGRSVAVSGDTLVMGAPQEDSNAVGVGGVGTDPDLDFNAGAAYVFVRQGAGWIQQAYLKPHNPGRNHQFGQAVAISGDTVVVGARGEDGFAGAAYVFVRTGNTWVQQAFLKASNAEESDEFGCSVAISGDTVVVGAIGEDSAAINVGGDQGNDPQGNSSGAAYVFIRSGNTWSQQAYLKASTIWTLIDFGAAVAVSGDIVVVGAPHEGSNSTGVNGNPFGENSPFSGAAYVFERAGGIWTRRAFLKAFNTGSLDRFGKSVAVSGNTVVVGASDEDSNATGVDGDLNNDLAGFSGAAYTYVKSGNTWRTDAYLKASNTDAGDGFGHAVAISGDTVVVGARDEGSSALGVDGNQADNSVNDAGAAYVFARSGTTWRSETYLKASNTGASDDFGGAVAMSDEWILVGATGEGSAALGLGGNQADNSASSAGAAYTFSVASGCHPETHFFIWDGGGADNLWTNPLNWLGDVAPGPGNNLIFPRTAPNADCVNDFPPDTMFTSISFRGAGAQAAYPRLRGNRIQLPSSLTVEGAGSGACVVDLPLLHPARLVNLSTTVDLEVRSAVTVEPSILSVEGPGVVRLTGTLTVNHPFPFESYVAVAGGHFIVNGTVSGRVVVEGGGVLGGGGSISRVDVSDGRLAPGEGGPGRLTVTDVLTLDPGATFTVELNGPVAGTQHDQVSCLRSVRSSPALEIRRAPDCVPAVGTEFLILNNEIGVSGPFAGLLQGASVMVDGVTYRVSYSAGTGNDLSLTVTAVPATPVLTRGPYLQSGTPTSVVVCWRTATPSDSRVTFGPAPDAQPFSATAPALVTDHVVTLTGLTPDTKYYYCVGASGGPGTGGLDHYFVTSPTTARPTRLWVIGDAGRANNGQRTVRDAYLELAAQENRPADLWLMLGDNAYESGTDEQYQRAVFDMYPMLLRNTHLWPTIGNHDSSPSAVQTPYLDIFHLPRNAEAGGVASGTEKYYSFDYGNIHFICLDAQSSSRAVNGPQHLWLQQDLADNTKDWLIAFWHHPPYTKGTHDSDNPSGFDHELVEMRENFLPLLEANGVDLVLCGHSHVYERSFLLDGHYGFSTELQPAMRKDAGNGRENTTQGLGPETGAYLKSLTGGAAQQGAVYVVAGSSGLPGSGALNHPAMFYSTREMGSLVLDVDGNRLDGRFLRETGVIEDHFTILKGVPPAPLEIVSTVTSGTPASRTMRLAFKTVAGQTYHVEKTATLNPANWQPASGPILATGATTFFTIALPPGSGPCFFRIVSP